MTIRKKIILFFICMVTLPITIIYFVIGNLFAESTEDALTNLFSANIREIGRNTDVFFRNAMHLSIYPLLETNLTSFLTTSPDSPDYERIRRNANGVLRATLFGYSDIVYGFRLTNMYADSIFSTLVPEISLENRSGADAAQFRPHWDYSTSHLPGGSIYLVRALRNPHNLSQQIGYIKLSLRSSYLLEFIRPPQTDEQISYYIIANNDNPPLVADSDYDWDIDLSILTFEYLHELANSPNPSMVVDGLIVSAYSLEHADLILYSITRADTLAIARNMLFTNILIYFILVLIFSFIIAIFFSKIVTKPIQAMGDYMTSISNEDFKVRYPVKGSDEIAVLSHHFNEMAERLDFLYNEVYLGELKLKQSQIKMLEAQINPHFLYNTLDTIYWMVKMGKSDESAAMVSNMSKMMRLTLAPKNNDYILLSQELEHLRCYIEIQKIRYGSKIDFSLSCPEYLYGQRVLSFLLQPLVENALTHGLSNRLKGIVSVNIYEQNEELIYEVSNDGEPIDISGIDQLINSHPKEYLKEESKEDSNEESFALSNLNNRLVLRYGDAKRLTYYIDGTFSVFRINQPKE